MFGLLESLYYFDKSTLLLGTLLVTLPLKIVIFIYLIYQGKKSQQMFLPLVFLLIVLLGGILEDFSWLLRVLRSMYIPNLSIHFTYFISRFSWGFCILQYQSLALLISSLLKKNYTVSIFQKCSIALSSVLSLFFFGKAFIFFNNFDNETRLFEISITTFIMAYIFVLTFTALVSSLFTLLKKRSLPKIIVEQLTLMVYFILAPHFVFSVLQGAHYWMSHYAIAEHYNAMMLIALQTISLSTAIVIFTKKIMRIRFLNFKQHVESSKKLHLINDFRLVLERLSKVTELNELSHISKDFIHNTLSIPKHKIHFFIRQFHDNHDQHPRMNQIEVFLDNMANKEEFAEAWMYLKQHGAFLKDEIEFNNFYKQSLSFQYIVQLFDEIGMNFFLPIIHKDIVIAYILMEPSSERGLYSNIERDEMVVFASYLSNIIYLHKNRNLEVLIGKEKQMKEELYLKHQENNQYKESIRLFLKDRLQRKIGIVFYKNRKFSFGNQDAQELIKINPNLQKGHDITRALINVASRVSEYNAPHMITTADHDGNSLVLSGIPNLESNNIIIAIYYPQIADIIKSQIDSLQDPSHWDYLLYLETTKSGKLINKLFPGNGETLLNFKISLLRLALTKKAILLNLADEDLQPTVEILHHISLRQHLHILDIQSSTKKMDLSVKLFGMNSHLIGKSSMEKPLLTKLDDGTLFIKNIHLLDIENQNRLSRFIKYGIYTALHSVKNQTSNARVICSTNQDLAQLVREGRFSEELYRELDHATAALPSLLTIPEKELMELTDTLTKQAVRTKEFHSLLELSDKEKQRIIKSKPVSITELQQKVQNILVLKSQENRISHEMVVEQSYDTADPQLIQAAQLGKHALKDPQIMTLLWNKFKNQNKIATFLGVNRSSVSRRCKLYKLS